MITTGLHFYTQTMTASLLNDGEKEEQTETKPHHVNKAPNYMTKIFTCGCGYIIYLKKVCDVIGILLTSTRRQQKINKKKLSHEAEPGVHLPEQCFRKYVQSLKRICVIMRRLLPVSGACYGKASARRHDKKQDQTTKRLRHNCHAVHTDCLEKICRTLKMLFPSTNDVMNNQLNCNSKRLGGYIVCLGRICDLLWTLLRISKKRDKAGDDLQREDASQRLTVFAQVCYRSYLNCLERICNILGMTSTSSNDGVDVIER